MSTICQLHADLRYYLCMQPVDMRKQFQGLQGIINAEFGRYITQDEAFIFIGKTGTTAKILHREHGGLTLYVRKLSRGRFLLPETAGEAFRGQRTAHGKDKKILKKSVRIFA